MSADEELARQLQRQYDAEDRRRRAEEAASERLAQRLAASSHTMSDSGDSDSASDQLWNGRPEDAEDREAAQLPEAAIASPVSRAKATHERSERSGTARGVGEHGERGAAAGKRRRSPPASAGVPPRRDGRREHSGTARGVNERGERGAAVGKRRRSPPASAGVTPRRDGPRENSRSAAGGKRRKLPPTITGAGPASTSPARTAVTPSMTSRGSPVSATRTAPRTAAGTEPPARAGPAASRTTETGGKPGTATRSDGGAADSGGGGQSAPRTECRYGARCYRLGNPVHTAAFSHPERPAQQPRPAGDTAQSSSGAKNGSTAQQKRPSGRTTVADKIREAQPVSFFLSKVRSVKSTYRERLALGFVELLDPSLGDLKSSLQINFLVDLEWLSEAYAVYGHQDKPLTVLHGIDLVSPPEGNVTAHKVKMPFLFGTHHTKMMLFEYAEGLRVVIHTGNLHDDDWRDKTQGLWVSPLLPPLSADAAAADGEAPTEFRADLSRYLSSYKLPCLAPWVERIGRHDFSAIRVSFVGSVPGRYQGSLMSRWGHLRVRHLLRTHAIRRNWDLIVQCSSIGRMGQAPEDWLLGEFRRSLTGGPSSARTAVIYPTEENVRTSVEGYEGGSCLPYQHLSHRHQLWLQDHLHQWRSDSRNRTGAMPHIKTYTQLSEDRKQLGWFILTSANLSKAAWGVLEKQEQQIFIRSYEAGVMYIPKLLDCESLTVLTGDTAVPRCISLPFSLPLVPYGDRDKPWFADTAHPRPDNNGAIVYGMGRKPK